MSNLEPSMWPALYQKCSNYWDIWGKLCFLFCSTFHNRSDKFSNFTPKPWKQHQNPWSTPKPWKQFQNPASSHPSNCSHQANQTLTYLFLYYIIVWGPTFAWKSKFSLCKSTNLNVSISVSNSAIHVKEIKSYYRPTLLIGWIKYKSMIIILDPWYIIQSDSTLELFRFYHFGFY